MIRDETAKWVFKRGVTLIKHQDEFALFSYFGERILLRGSFSEKILEKIYASLQSPQTFNSILDFCEGFGDIDGVQRLFTTLVDARFLEKVDTTESASSEGVQNPNLSDFLGYFSSRSSSVSQTLAKLKSYPIAIVDSGVSELATDLQKALSACGFQCVDSMSSSAWEKQPNSQLMFATGDWWSLSQLENLNETALREKRRWIPVLHDFFGGTVGPTLGIEGGACLACLIKRRQTNLIYPEHQRNVETFYTRTPSARIPLLTVFSQALAAFAATETLKLVAEFGVSKLAQGLYEYDLLNHRNEFHSVLPLPYCHICSPLDNRPRELYKSLR